MRISDWSSDVCASDLLGREMMIAIMREIPFDAARLEDLGVGREQGFGARQVAALDRLLILRQRRRRRLIIRGWRRVGGNRDDQRQRSEEHTSELQSLMRIPYAVFCLKKKKKLKTY